MVVDCKNRTPPVVAESDFAVVRTPNVREGKFVIEDLRYTDEDSYREWTTRAVPQIGDILITREAPLGEVCAVPGGRRVCLGQRMMLYRPSSAETDSSYLLYALMSSPVRTNLLRKIGGSTVGHAKVDDIRYLQFARPPLHEQRAIAAALRDVDALLEGLTRLIAKKRDLKQAAMQQLLTGQTRLPGFHDEWQVKTLEESADCLDGLRVPLNEAQRAQMKGDIPYCGANGVLDFVNDFVIDDDIILMAEDGGYFDEYETRPIAYRMNGKCWVNNHAHILKSKPGFDQGFLFYSLVHKNILPFLASGTRAKLNKSEMNRIVVRFPHDEAEQTAIAAVLSEMDAEIAALEARRDKTRALKQAMMQELLTGRTRLV